MKFLNVLSLTATIVGLASAEAAPADPPPKGLFDLKISGSQPNKWVVPFEVDGKLVASYSDTKGEPYRAGTDPVTHIAFDKDGKTFYSTIEEVTNPNNLVFIEDVQKSDKDNHVVFHKGLMNFDITEGNHKKWWNVCDGGYFYVGHALDDCEANIFIVVPRE